MCVEKQPAAQPDGAAAPIDGGSGVEAFIDAVAWDERGLAPAIAQDSDGAVLMMAWMSRASLEETLNTGQVTYWSRSRKALWRKGETSGHRQRLIEARVDCDRDCLLMIVNQTGPACHTNRRSCFYTAFREGASVEIMAPMVDAGDPAG